MNVEKIISDASPLEAEEWKEKIVDAAMSAAKKYSEKNNIPIGYSFAAAFDLVVAAHYYGNVANKGWLYCGSKSPLLLYPYTNTCPRCAAKDKFYFHKANKPRSGNIGSITSTYLCLCYKWFFKNSGHDVKIMTGREPVDVVFLDRKGKSCLFAEIKASPLVTFPLATDSEKLTEENESGTESVGAHSEVTVPRLMTSNFNILLPGSDESVQLISIGKKLKKDDFTWATKSISELCKSDEFVNAYFGAWLDAFRKYKGELPREGSYWLTNSCGAPSPMPDAWPKRSMGAGYETISNNKTSVGMDRTDDIKKGTYQVLKIGSVSKFPKSATWDVSVGLVSNIHSVQHFEEYLESIKDVVWTKAGEKIIKIAKELPPDAEISNLFDGIISFTSCEFRNDWLKKILTFGA